VDPTLVFTTLKELAGLAKKANQIELTQKVIDLQTLVMTLVQDQWDLQKDAEKLRREKADLEKDSELAGRLQFKNNAYWIDGSTAEENGPICSACWDGDRKLVRMVRFPDNVGHCNRCDKNARYGRSAHDEGSRRSIMDGW